MFIYIVFYFLEGRAAKIQENLKHLKIAAQKKKLAQEHYYGQGRSPMVRTASGNFAKQNVVHQQQNNRQQNSRQQNSRQSFQQNNRQNFQRNVRQRLGQVNNNNANTNPNSFTRNANRKQFIPNVKQQKLNRVNQFVNKQQRRNNINPRTQQGNVKVHSLLTGEVRYLRPLGSKPKPARPTNYTVRVDNVKSNNTNNNYRHHAGLNANIQQQIRLIQNKPLVEPNLVTQIVMPQRDTAPTVPIMTTRTTLHERFSMM